MNVCERTTKNHFFENYTGTLTLIVLFGVIFFGVFYFVFYNMKADEIFRCDKNQNICTYTYNTHGDATFKKKRLFDPSDIRNIKKRTYETRRHTKNGTRTTTHYVIDIYLKNGRTEQYPIHFHSETHQNTTYYHFNNYLQSNQSFYEDIKKGEDEKKAMHLFLIISLIFVGYIIYVTYRDHLKHQKLLLRKNGFFR